MIPKKKSRGTVEPTAKAAAKAPAMPYSNLPHARDRVGTGIGMETPQGRRRMSFTKKNLDLMQVVHVTVISILFEMSVPS